MAEHFKIRMMVTRNQGCRERVMVNGCGVRHLRDQETLLCNHVFTHASGTVS